MKQIYQALLSMNTGGCHVYPNAGLQHTCQECDGRERKRSSSLLWQTCLDYAKVESRISQVGAAELSSRTLRPLPKSSTRFTLEQKEFAVMSFTSPLTESVVAFLRTSFFLGHLHMFLCTELQRNLSVAEF